HRPAVYIDQHLFWYFMSANVWHLNLTFGSFHIASSAYQNWPTRHLYILIGRFHRKIKAKRLAYPFEV
ncbi:conserved hypothetical protein, partial [Trichinella spiralis]|uniref:hypothetical protein n=1 Tax=Trichinella spiralis TaxID=6334 RepID=UPI0001EFDD0A